MNRLEEIIAKADSAMVAKTPGGPDRIVVDLKDHLWLIRNLEKASRGLDRIEDHHRFVVHRDESCSEFVRKLRKEIEGEL